MPVVLYKRQRQILEFVQHFIKKYGYSPTLMEIAKAMGLSSPATIHEHLRILEKKGVISRADGEVRGISVVAEVVGSEVSLDPAMSTDLPLLGYIAAGQPLMAYSDPSAT